MYSTNTWSVTYPSGINEQVTEEIPNLPSNLPTFRDPDHLVYFKPDGRGINNLYLHLKGRD
jgi:hypothetical protein